MPNGIDLKRFERTEDTENLVPMIGTVAALRAEKNLARLIRAFARLKVTTSCQLVIVGDGPERGTLEKLAHDLGVANDVTFAGQISDPSRFYRQFDIFALTSDTEQMPYTVLEAMAASCPIVATDVGDIREMVSSPNRPFILAKDDDAISDALRNLLEDSVLRKELAAANLQTVPENYSQDGMFRAFAEIYDVPGLIAT